MLVRRAIKADIPAINCLLRQVLDVHHQGRPDLFKGGVKKYSDAQLEVILSAEDTPVFVAETDGQVYGYAFCCLQQISGHNVLQDVKTLDIDDLCVDESVRGKKIGSILFDYVKQFAKEHGCYNLTLNVWACNPSAAKFYEKMGMQPQKTYLESIL